MGIPFGDSPLLLLVPRTYFRWDSCWNYPVGVSELIPFVARSDRFCYLRSAEIPSLGFLLVSPRWGFTLIFCSQGTQFSPVGGLLFVSFLGELHPSLKNMQTRIKFEKNTWTWLNLRSNTPTGFNFLYLYCHKASSVSLPPQFCFRTNFELSLKFTERWLVYQHLFLMMLIIGRHP